MMQKIFEKITKEQNTQFIEIRATERQFKYKLQYCNLYFYLN